MKQASSKAQADVDEARQVAEAAESAEERKKAEERLGAASEQLSRVKTQLDSIPVRGLDVYEHPALLERALSGSKDRLLMISPWIRAKIVNRSFMSKLDMVLPPPVWPSFHRVMDSEVEAEPRRRRAKKMKRLTEVREFHVCRLGDTHAKVVISDRNFIVTTSFNWLSFKGDPNRTFRDEQGTFVAIPDFIDQRFEHLVSRFGPDHVEDVKLKSEVFHGYRLTKQLLRWHVRGILCPP